MTLFITSSERTRPHYGKEMGPLSGVALEGNRGTGSQVPDGDMAAVQRANNPVSIGRVEESVLHGLRRQENAIGVFWNHCVP